MLIIDLIDWLGEVQVYNNNAKSLILTTWGWLQEPKQIKWEIVFQDRVVEVHVIN